MPIAPGEDLVSRKRIARLKALARRFLPLSVRLRMELRRTHRAYLLKIADAEARKNSAALTKLRKDYDYAVWELQDEIAEVNTEYWLKAAARYHVPVPWPSRSGHQIEPDENWRNKYDHTAALLTTRGIATIRGMVREEKKWRRESWMTWLAALTGIIGALTGLASVLRGP